MSRSFLKRGSVAVAALLFCLSCASSESSVEGLAQSGASGGDSATGQGQPGAPVASISTSDQAQAIPSSDAGDAVEATASEVVLTSASNEMNTQPDDSEWGLLNISDAYTTLQVDDITATTDTKLVVIDIEITIGKFGNLFDSAFRLQADGEWYSPLNVINMTTRVGEIYNGIVIFEIPRPPTTVILEAGLPESLHQYDWSFPLRNTAYTITLI